MLIACIPEHSGTRGLEILGARPPGSAPSGIRSRWPNGELPAPWLALISVALLALAALVERPSGITTGIGLAVFGLGFGMVGQVLTIAVQNSVQGRELGQAMAVTGFFRALGGAVGAAVLGAVFASRVGHTGTATLTLAHAARLHVISGVHAVFLVTSRSPRARAAGSSPDERLPARLSMRSVQPR